MFKLLFAAASGNECGSYGAVIIFGRAGTGWTARDAAVFVVIGGIAATASPFIGRPLGAVRVNALPNEHQSVPTSSQFLKYVDGIFKN